MPTSTLAPVLFAVADAKVAPNSRGRLSAQIFRHGTLELRWYAPRGVDAQVPHTRDEVYVVVSGSGRFRRGDQESAFGPGDALFVAAGIEHRFENFSDDFGCWVIFYGPEGGEADRGEG
jgi:mannose-6-phosphate isomerase-like protein (cupin superfamily)